MSDAVEIKGFDELAENFTQLEDALSVRKAASELTGALITGLRVFVENARMRAHQLSASVPLFRRRQWPTTPLHVAQAIQAQWAKSDANEVAAVAGVPSSHFWGLFLEYGTKTARAFPFLRPSWAPVDVLNKVAAVLVEKLARARLRVPK